MAITLTEAAARHVSRYLARRGQGLGVRLGVKTSGCSGLAYQLEYVDQAEPEDVVFENHGVKLLIDPKSLAYIDGTELDFVREGLNEGFRFSNPNARDRCGCGVCFRVWASAPSDFAVEPPPHTALAGFYGRPYICSIITCPKPEQLTCRAPSIRRAKS